MVTILEQTPVEIDLVAQAKSTGWTIDGQIAYHEVCNAGSIYLKNYPMTTGVTYTFSYRINSIANGSLQAFSGTQAGSLRTTAGDYTETLVASGTNPEFRFYSNADCAVEIFDIKNTIQSVDMKQRNTIVWSERSNKWNAFRTMTYDVGYSMFTNMYSFKFGTAYIHRQGSLQRNYFYNTQYQSIINIPFNQAQGQPKTFASVSYEANRLLITTTDGITTSLGQISELIALDFLKTTLIDGVTTINVYDSEGIYSAGFMRDKNVDIVNGDQLKGTYITIDLTTVSEGVLNLKNVFVHSEASKIGSR